MKITGIEPVLAGKRYLFLKITTDEGLIGWGECGAWGYQEATAQVLKQMEQLLIGMDPLLHGIYLECPHPQPAFSRLYYPGGCFRY